MIDIKYVTASQKDFPVIAQLHAESWKKHYRGICPDDYLDHEVDEDRRKVWQKRFSEKNPLQGVIVAKHENKMIGFVCTYLDFHNEHGAYLDNLHVLSEYQGHGIGKMLMTKTAQWVKNHRPKSKIYLHVLEKNEMAMGFYRKIGGRQVGPFIEEMPWKGKGTLYDFLWDLDQLTD